MALHKMKTLHVGQTLSGYFTPCHDVKYFCIGVKNMTNSLECLQEKYPTMKIERLNEVINPRYLSYGKEYVEKSHTLQPAYVTLPAPPKTSEKKPKEQNYLDLKKGKYE